MTRSKAPIIGITTDHNDPLTGYASPFGYAQGVHQAGGVPLLIPHRIDFALIPQILDRLDGILFTGGDDLDPCLYGQAWNPNAIPVDRHRQDFELELMRQVEARRLPTIGICMGSQVMNVHRGGSLFQFLPEVPRDNALEHRTLDKTHPIRHDVKLDATSTLGQRVGQEQFVINSYHKQSIDRLGQGLRIIATAPDGVIEAIEDPTLPLWLGVQWHPERMLDTPEHRAIFELLIERSCG